MSELRQDPLTGRWVIMAAGRGARPDEFGLRGREAADAAGTESCPFCPGHEDQTTPEILALGRPDPTPNSAGWRVRVFPNMYPALDPDADAEPDAAPTFWTRSAGAGFHEVVVYSPDHAAAPADMSPVEWAELLSVLRGRVRAMADQTGVVYISPFCNHGPEGGATLSHPHLQIIATGEVPDLAVQKAQRWDAHQAESGTCLLCELVAAEKEAGRRVVAAGPGGCVLTPWASRFPYEMLLVPAVHRPGLDVAADDELEDLGRLMCIALGGLRRLHGDLSLNLVFHSAPRVPAGGSFDDPRLAALARPPADLFHWHVEILPRLSRTAGFEVGTGFSINAILPEVAAAHLRGEGG